MITSLCFGPEEGADMVALMTGSMKVNLFEMLVGYFNLTDGSLITITDFARMSGFLTLEFSDVETGLD